jgi:hypothetical protein
MTASHTAVAENLSEVVGAAGEMRIRRNVEEAHTHVDSIEMI